MMKLKNIKWLLCILLAPIFASCSWEELPSYEDANITNIQFNYRWASDVYSDDATGEPLVLEWQLNTANVDINTDAGTVTLEVNVPNPQSFFTADVRNGITQDKLCCTVTLSTAARLEVADNHNILGIPDDWTVPHKFVVTAANGTKKTWTITVTALNK